MQDLVKSDCIVLFLVLLASAIYKTFCEVPNFRNKTFKNTPVVSFGMRGVGAILTHEFINWIWIATRFRDRQIWRTGSGNSAILAPKSSDKKKKKKREKTPIFETKAAASFLMPQGVLCLK